VHCFDGLREARVAEAEQDSGVDQTQVHGGAEEEHEDVLEEAVEGGLASGEVGGGLGEEELEGGCELGQGVEGKDEGLGEGRGEWVEHAGAELDGCADEFGAVVVGGVKAVLVGAGEEDDAWGFDNDWTGVRVGDRQSSFSEQVKVAGLFVEVGGDTAEGSGVEHPGGEGELLEEWGESVHERSLMRLKGISARL